MKHWLLLARASNLPTVWSNVFHGLAAGLFVSALDQHGPAAIDDLPREPFWYFNQGFMLLLSMSLIYAAGMILNDAFDAKHDAVHRPERPIPAGRVTRRAAAIVGSITLILGLAATTVYTSRAVTIFAGALAFCVLAYNATHRRDPLFATVFMAACRALVILAAAAAFAPPFDAAWNRFVALPAAAIAVYIAMVTLLARREHLDDSQKRPIQIGLLLAALPLLDAFFLARIDQWPLAGVCILLAVATILLQRVLPGT